jgi:Ca2+-binding EF-hand superfamily protein
MQTIKDIRKVFKKNSPSLEKDFRHIILFRDFKKALVATTGRAFPETEKELRSAFDTIDTDKSGSVGFEKLRQMVKEFDSNYTEEDIHDMLGTLDLSKTGKLTWEAFRKQFANDRDM